MVANSAGGWRTEKKSTGRDSSSVAGKMEKSSSLVFNGPGPLEYVEVCAVTSVHFATGCVHGSALGGVFYMGTYYRFSP